MLYKHWYTACLVCLALAVPIKLQNETTYAHATQHKVDNLKMNWYVDYSSIVDVQKWHKSKEFKIAIHCCWFTRPACSLYFTTLRLLVKSASQNSTKLQMSPRTKNEVVTDIAWQLVKITRHF